MKLQDQVITIEQAKKLKELGVNAPSLFYHVEWNASDYTGVFIAQECNKGFYHAIDGEVETFSSTGDEYPAYTVAELFEMIPHMRCDELFTVMPPNEGNEYLWTCLYLPIVVSISEHSEANYRDGNTLAECLGSFLIYLLENSLITPSQVNNQLK